MRMASRLFSPFRSGPCPTALAPDRKGKSRLTIRELRQCHEPLEQRGVPPMAIIDSQVHVYEANTPKRPWHNVPNWPDHVTGDEMVVAIDKVGVDGAIFISAFSMYQYD